MSDADHRHPGHVAHETPATAGQAAMPSLVLGLVHCISGMPSAAWGSRSSSGRSGASAPSSCVSKTIQVGSPTSHCWPLGGATLSHEWLGRCACAAGTTHRPGTTAQPCVVGQGADSTRTPTNSAARTSLRWLALQASREERGLGGVAPTHNTPTQEPEKSREQSWMSRCETRLWSRRNRRQQSRASRRGPRNTTQRYDAAPHLLPPP